MKGCRIFMITNFFGVLVKNGANFPDNTEEAFKIIYDRFEGVRVDVPETDLSLFYYKDPKFGQHVLAYYLEDGNLYQIGVTKPYALNAEGYTFNEIHAEGLGKLKKEEEKPEPETPAEPKPEDPKEELPTTDEPTKEVEEPKEPEAPKDETPKEEKPADEPADKPKEETPVEELPEANRGEDVFVRDGKYFVKRFDENGNAVEIFVKKAPNAFDAETGEMTLEEAPEGEEIFSVDGRYYYIDKVADRIIYVKEPKKAEEPKEEPTPEEPKPDEPKPEEPEVPAEPNPSEPEPEKPGEEKEEPKGPESLLNGVRVVIKNDLDDLAVKALEGKEFTLSEDGKVRIYELLKALAVGEITVELFFHELETGVLSKAFVNAGVETVDLIGLRKKIEAVIAEVLNINPNEATPR